MTFQFGMGSKFNSTEGAKIVVRIERFLFWCSSNTFCTRLNKEGGTLRNSNEINHHKLANKIHQN